MTRKFQNCVRLPETFVDYSLAIVCLSRFTLVEHWEMV